ncbi:MAG: prephenate dehydrogenase/arogenate dehydrogenase family protein [Candidatus Thorarchaeota archaeon]|jgi:prephenate dehydrogenase
MKITVIGGAGRMGRWLLKHFSTQGATLVASDPKKNELKDLAVELNIELAKDNKQAVGDADVVVISVPMELTEVVVQEVVPIMKRRAVLCEISSIKTGALKTLRSAVDYPIQTLSIHPLFGQGAQTLRKRIALIPVTNEENELRIVKSLFPESEIIVVDAEEHDRTMALTISLPYFVNLIVASILRDEDISSLQKLGGTTFRVQLMLTASVMSNSCALHLGMHKENAYVFDILKKFQERTRIGLASLSDEIDDFGEFYSRVKEALGKSVNLNEKYDEMYRVLGTLEDLKGSEVGS